MEVAINDKLKKFINKLEPDFEAVKVNSDMKFESEARFAIQILQLERNRYLMSIARNNTRSLQNAVTNVAAIGLTLNPSLGLAYLVPRKDDVCLDISYLGLMKLAQDTGNIKDIKAEIVYAEDEFVINGAFSEPTHKYSPFSDRGNMVGAYVVASTRHNTFLTTTMPIDEILSIRDMSESWKSEKKRKYSPWLNFEKEMIKKTVIRRAYKSWSKEERSDAMERAIVVSDEAQGIEFKSQYQIEQEELEKDFPIPKEEKELGSPLYRVQHAKFRGKQLQDIPVIDLENYLITLDKRHEKHDPKMWELDLKSSISAYLESLENDAIENIGEGIEL